MIHRRKQETAPAAEATAEPSRSFSEKKQTGGGLRRVVLTVAAFIAGLLILRSLSASGSGARSALAASRRTDAAARESRKHRAAAAVGAAGGAVAALNFSDPAPFTFCPTYGPSDELGALYGEAALTRTRLFTGSKARVRKVLRRAMQGFPITVSVLGGSISSCHGLDPDAGHPFGNPVGPNCYPRKVFDWLNDVFPHPANELTNGALRRTGTAYFGYCAEMHLPDRVDLVIVEFDTEDPQDPQTLASTDLLIRSLLLRPDQPAVILLGHFSPQIQGESGYAGPETLHTAVAQFYDVPHVSTKGLLYDNYVLHPDSVKRNYYLDPILANANGHKLLADTLIAFLEAEICSVWEQSALAADLVALGVSPRLLNLDPDAHTGLLSGKLRKGDGEGDDVEKESANGLSPPGAYMKLPPFRVTDHPHSLPGFREIKPACASANDLINPLPASVFQGTGWNPVAPKPEDEDEVHYWYSDVPGSFVKIPIKCGAGDIAVYYMRGPASEGWGSVLCWVDDNTAGAVTLDGAWDRDYAQATVMQIDQHVARGSHYVVCELQGQPGVDQARFKLLGVFST